MKIKRIISLKRDFPLDIISRMEKIASRKIIDRKDKKIYEYHEKDYI